jgi:TonB family protein
LVSCSLVFPAIVNAQTFAPIFNGRSLDGWIAEHRNTAIENGVLTLNDGPGWVRTKRVFGNFILRLDVRAEDGAVADIYVRGWPTFDRDRRPTNASLVPITGKPVAGSDGWQRLEIEALGTTLTVRSGGQVIYTSATVPNPQGHIALAVSGKAAQFRNLEIQPAAPRAPPPVTAGVREVARGVSSPRAIENPTPRYTAEALRARITGQVTMTAVVRPEGNVTDVQLVQSLDPHFGLDRVAVDTVSKWRFEPGRLDDGQAVAVRVVIELEFNLR